MSDATLRTIAAKIARDLFTNGSGQRAQRLVLTIDGPPVRDLGGWSTMSEWQRNWTVDSSGTSNNSELFHEIVDYVAARLRNISLGDDVHTAARRIVAGLAHTKGMAPVFDPPVSPAGERSEP